MVSQHPLFRIPQLIGRKCTTEHLPTTTTSGKSYFLTRRYRTAYYSLFSEQAARRCPGKFTRPGPRQQRLNSPLFYRRCQFLEPHNETVCIIEWRFQGWASGPLILRAAWVSRGRVFAGWPGPGGRINTAVAVLVLPVNNRSAGLSGTADTNTIIVAGKCTDSNRSFQAVCDKRCPRHHKNTLSFVIRYHKKMEI